MAKIGQNFVFSAQKKGTGLKKAHRRLWWRWRLIWGMVPSVKFVISTAPDEMADPRLRREGKGMVLGRVERQRDLIFWYMRHWDVSCSKCTLKRYFQIIFSKDNLRLSSHNIFLYMRYWDVPCSKLWPPKPPALLHFCEPSERHLMWVLKCFSIASEKC